MMLLLHLCTLELRSNLRAFGPRQAGIQKTHFATARATATTQHVLQHPTCTCRTLVQQG